MAALSLTDRQLSYRFISCIVVYFALHVLLRVLISGSLDYDEAEQALLSQWLRPGYTEQPPLYSWLQYYLFQLLGKNVFAVSLLKNGLLCLTYICLFGSGRILFGESRPAVLAALSLLLIPQIGWESQRDMTHTTLVVFAASATLLQSLRMTRRRNLLDFLLLGVLLGIGILAKANFALFVFILFASLLSTAEARKFLLSPAMVLTLLVTAGMTGPYFGWMYMNQDIVFSATHKFKVAEDNYYLKGIASLVRNCILFLTPLWLVYLALFPAGYLPEKKSRRAVHQVFLFRYMLIFAITLVAVVLLFKVTYVKDRWLQPLLFVFPLFYFSRIDFRVIAANRFRYFIGVVFVAMAAVYTAFTIRVAGASYTGRFCRMNYPFAEMAADIRQAGFDSGLIISDNRFIAGNLHLQFPGSAAIVPDYRFEELVKAESLSGVLVVWNADSVRVIPQNLASFVKEKYNIAVSKHPVKYYRHTYQYGRHEQVTLAALHVQLPHAGRGGPGLESVSN
jgi:4-amino-4-deoxy-L-arabinose transferase-like glycosyltransferase